MKISYDDQHLVTVSEDACVMIWKIQDKEGRGLKRDKELSYAEEILITKSDLEEKVSESSEKRPQVPFTQDANLATGVRKWDTLWECSPSLQAASKDLHAYLCANLLTCPV